MHVWVVRKGIPASKNKQEAREALAEELSETYKGKGPEMLASESKHRSPDATWCPWSRDAMTVLDYLDFRKIKGNLYHILITEHP